MKFQIILIFVVLSNQRYDILADIFFQPSYQLSGSNQLLMQNLNVEHSRYQQTS